MLVEAQVPAKEQGRRLGLITSGPGTKVRSEGQERLELVDVISSVSAGFPRAWEGEEKEKERVGSIQG